MRNICFELTEVFNRDEPTVALASGQAVVFYRIAIMSKDGDWVIRETPQACERVLVELEARGARYRHGRRLARYEQAAIPYIEEYRRTDLTDLPLRAAHERICNLAERVLPTGSAEAQPDADAE